MTRVVRSWLDRILVWFHAPATQPAGAVVRQLPWRRVLPVAALGLLAAGLIVGHRVGLPQELDPVAPFTVGYGWGMDTALAALNVSLSSGPSEIGYDGQWFLGQAYDPLLRHDVVSTFDAPRYRALRGLLPATGWLLAAGQPPAIPYALLAMQLLAVGLGCAACARIGSAYRRSPWWGLGFAVIPGVIVGVAYGTAEPLGLALAALGMSLLLDQRYGWAGLAFAGAALTKETYLAFAVATAVYLAVDRYLAGRGTRGVGRSVVPVVAPGVVALAAWWGYVAMALPPDEAPERVLRVFDVPLLGWWDALVTIARGSYPNHVYGWTGEPVMVGTFGLLALALVVVLWRRRSVLAYSALIWGTYGLTLSGLLLGRFLSAQRALAPAVLAAMLLLLTAGRILADRDTGDGAGEAGRGRGWRRLAGRHPRALSAR